MSWQKAYLATCIVLEEPEAGRALGPSCDEVRRELALDAHASKQARARRLADAIQSILRDLERMEQPWPT